MYGSRIVSGLAAVFAGMAVLFAVFAVVFSPVFLAVAAVFGAAAYFVWYHASGRMARRLYRGVEGRADPGAGSRASADATGDGFGAGPREEWEPPRDGRSAREQRARAGPNGSAGRGPRANAGRGGQRRSAGDRRRERGRAPVGSSSPTVREAYRTLGLDPDADAAAVKAAYREKVKEVHPDTEGGDEDRFKDVNAAYERLTDD